ncbi:general vesicular transport factor p115 [Ehrlichia ruminantium]|uniref:General vesicular transport factor p115 n=1 Tax=Ehrlichia ruminantium TaxID=779 RepID=A0A170QZH3_EHRRU|nr:general vesicular transport factor p115 [Ehrlichia ruminantium]GAT77667.1 general vesicular transport factor p115 [Ehrlichia ruminantium]GAT78837.1 general vesicular transport factor p115 [Ehrlichia ruminantium]
MLIQINTNKFLIVTSHNNTLYTQYKHINFTNDVLSDNYNKPNRYLIKQKQKRL